MSKPLPACGPEVKLKVPLLFLCCGGVLLSAVEIDKDLIEDPSMDSISGCGALIPEL